ncbi:MAG: DUF4416 family protein [Planctomycetes bacterium]|nr:DUF4416 family protein [Planctomycetota bacterium]
MGEIQPSQPVKLFIGMISGRVDYLPEITTDAPSDVERALADRFGPIDTRSPVFDFDATSYYEPTMGPGLKKIFFSFQNLIDPSEIVGIKIATNQLETKYQPSPNSGVATRSINLDPGYLDGGKLILASTKNHAHRLYLNQGIYAEVTLMYVKGLYQSLNWTYPDYRQPEYHDYFQQVRLAYLAQTKI